MEVASIETVIDKMIAKLQVQGFTPLPENLKSYYLKACWILSKLQQKRMISATQAALDKRQPRVDHGEEDMIELMKRELGNLRVRPA
jgi:hypothetical protein